MTKTPGPLDVPYRERERSITMDRLDHPDVPLSGTELHPETELFTINIGPHPPATHGVLRLLVTLEGEYVREITPLIGYVHTGIEKSCEDQAYWKVIPFVERMDYLSYYFNAMAFCMAVERLLELEVPARAQYLRVIHMELNRIASHLFWMATSILDFGAISFLWWGIRERDLVLDLFEMSSGQRLHTRYFQIGGVVEDIPPGWEQKCREFIRVFPSRLAQYEALPYSSYDHFDFKVPVGTEGDHYDRYRVRMEEMRQSLRIVEQALDGLPEGPFIADDRKY